jgi:uncharacterized protein
MDYYVDTGYWIAILSALDQWHSRAVAVSKRFAASDRFYTSDFVLLELMNFFSASGPLHRSNVCTMVDWIQTNSNHIVLPISQQHFLDSRRMYKRHADKEWSLTDCSSFLLMKEFGIEDVLTFDRHFNQAGFRTLLGAS